MFERRLRIRETSSGVAKATVKSNRCRAEVVPGRPEGTPLQNRETTHTLGAKDEAKSKTRKSRSLSGMTARFIELGRTVLRGSVESNPHPLKAEGAAPRNRQCRRMVLWMG